MNVHESQYVSRFIDEENQLVISTWLETTENMTTREFKEEMQSLADLIKEKKIKFVLSITKELRFTIVPELQQWILDVIAPQFIEAKIEKQAIIIPQEFIAQLSMEQTIDDVENINHHHQSKFFSEIEDAKNWLFSKDPQLNTKTYAK